MADNHEPGQDDEGIGDRDRQVSDQLAGMSATHGRSAPETKMCPACSARVPAGERFCHACGHAFDRPTGVSAAAGRFAHKSGEVRGCPSCFEPAEPGDRFCRHCGGPIDGPRREPPTITMSPVAEDLLDTTGRASTGATGPPRPPQASPPQPAAAASPPPGTPPPQRRRGKLFALFAAGVALAAVGGGGTYAAITLTRHASHGVRVAQHQQLPPSFATLVDQVKTGVVELDVNTCNGEQLGTGFLVGPQQIATVDHVVDGATSISVKQNGQVLASGTVIGSDSARDLALVRTDQKLPGRVFTLSSATPQLGDNVATLGFPLGLPLTVTRGTVSGTSRTVPIDGTDRSGLVQTDAAVNPGNSGGPLLAASNGQVVGLVDIGTSEFNGIAFAVAATTAAPLLSAWEAAPQPASAPACTGDGGGGNGGGVTPPVQASNPQALASVDSYWSDIDNGDFTGAYQYLVPGTGGGESEWIAGEQGAGVQSAAFTGHVTDSSDTNATVAVDSLQTTDSQSGCQNWSGTYSIVNQGGSWLIASANITPSPCN